MGMDPLGMAGAQPATPLSPRLPVPANDNFRPRPRLVPKSPPPASGGWRIARGAGRIGGRAFAVVGAFTLGWDVGDWIGKNANVDGFKIDEVIGVMWDTYLGAEGDERFVSPYAPRPGSRTDEEWVPVFDSSGKITRFLPAPHALRAADESEGGGEGGALMLHPFARGASHITTTEALAQFAHSPTYGGPGGLYVAPSGQIDILLARATSRRDIEVALGLDEGTLRDGLLVRIDIEDPLARGLRLPDPASGNSHHRPGTGLTTGGLNEAVIDSPLKRGSDVLKQIVGGGG